MVKLQRARNYAARLSINIGKYSSAIPVPHLLHWLLVPSRISFKKSYFNFEEISCIYESWPHG